MSGGGGGGAETFPRSLQNLTVTTEINILGQILVKCTTNLTNYNLFRSCTYKTIINKCISFLKVLGGGGGGGNKKVILGGLQEVINIIIFY